MDHTEVESEGCTWIHPVLNAVRLQNFVNKKRTA
jgi:hypothetical protein